MMAIVPFPSMSPTLSLILTIGSNDRLLRRCVNALASQTFEDVELIVADCSFCGYADALRRKLPRVKGNIAVKFIEGSPQTPRWEQLRHAVDAASGTYVIFADPAQWLEPEAAACLVACMQHTGADFAEMRSVGRIKGVPVKNGNSVPDEIAGDALIDNGQLREYSRFIGDGSYITPSINDKIYRRDLLAQVFAVNYPGDVSAAEMVNVQYVRHAASMVFLSYAGLNYNSGDGIAHCDCSALAEAKMAYTHKVLSGQDEACCRGELASRLRRHVRSLIIDGGWTPEAAQFFMQCELADPFWRGAGITVSAAELTDGVDRRERWLDFRRILSRLFH